MNECYMCQKEFEDMLVVWHKHKDVIEPHNICFKCLYERGKYEHLKPENNVFNEEEYKRECH